MVTEVAIFIARPGKEGDLGQGIIHGIEFIRQHPECISANATHCIEKPERYMLSVVWTSLEAHVNGFRSSALYNQWRNEIGGLFEENPEVCHYQVY
jgi:quinol monooxygenase YgiN